MYAIENTSGQWWTGECWGVEQARAEYGLQELPYIIDEAIRSDHWVSDEYIDIRYYLADDEDAIASVRKV